MDCKILNIKNLIEVDSFLKGNYLGNYDISGILQPVADITFYDDYGIVTNVFQIKEGATLIIFNNKEVTMLANGINYYSFVQHLNNAQENKIPEEKEDIDVINSNELDSIFKTLNVNVNQILIIRNIKIPEKITITTNTVYWEVFGKQIIAFKNIDKDTARNYYNEVLKSLGLIVDLKLKVGMWNGNKQYKIIGLKK